MIADGTVEDHRPCAHSDGERVASVRAAARVGVRCCTPLVRTGDETLKVDLHTDGRGQLGGFDPLWMKVKPLSALTADASRVTPSTFMRL